MQSPVSKNTVYVYLSGGATAIEKQLVEEWLKQESNRELFYEYLAEWEKGNPQFVPDTEGALRQLHLRLEAPEEELHTAVPEEYPGGLSVRHAYGWKKWVAAASVLLSMLAALWMGREQILYRTLATPYGGIDSLTLDDGTQVFLNANSELKVPRWGFGKGDRQVSLRGEAEFSVTHTTDSRRFIVRTSDEFQVEVLGTEFSVFARPRGTRVVLSRGKIRVDLRENQRQKSLPMSPGDRLSRDNTGKLEMTRVDTPADHAAWKEQRFVFNGTSVAAIAEVLEDNFGVYLKPLDPGVLERTISGNYQAASAEELVSILKEVLNLDVMKIQDTVVVHQRR